MQILITEVTAAAFKTLEINNYTEQFIIIALRVAKALTVSLVAELYGLVIGHVAFSLIAMSDVTAQACLGVAGVSSEGGWHNSDSIRTVPTEETECCRMLRCRASELLQEVWIRESSWTRTGWSVSRGILRSFLRREYSSRHG